MLRFALEWLVSLIQGPVYGLGQQSLLLDAAMFLWPFRTLDSEVKTYNIYPFHIIVRPDIYLLTLFPYSPMIL